MSNNFLDKVIDQIVNETTIDYDDMEKGRMYTPFFHSESTYQPPLVFILFSSLYSSNGVLFSFFSKHCEEVYGLNKEEIKYVWNEYKQIIIYKYIN
jgi:hypothetical protein